MASDGEPAAGGRRRSCTVCNQQCARFSGPFAQLPRRVWSALRSGSFKFAEAVQDAFPEEKHPAAFHGALAQLSGPGGWTAVNDIVKATNLARLECNAGDAQGASDQTAFRTVVWDDMEVSQLAEALIQTLVVAQVCWPQRMHACVSRGGRRGDF